MCNNWKCPLKEVCSTYMIEQDEKVWYEFKIVNNHIQCANFIKHYGK